MVAGSDGRLPLPWLEAPLREALQRQHGHALLVQAPEGVGTFEFMRTLAQAWLCEDAGGRRPCGRCAACRLVQGRSHPDLHLLVPEARRAALAAADAAGDEEPTDAGRSGKRKPSRQIRIDEVRAAVDWIVHSSSRGRAKVVLLYPAEAMNLQAASALLKSLEEPPGRARWLLGTADAGRLLPTVRSRCLRIVLPQPEPSAARDWLAAQGVEGAEVLLAAAGGRPLEARDLAAAGVGADAWCALPGAVARGQAAVLAGWPVARIVDALLKLCHDAQVHAVGGRPRYFPAERLVSGASLERLAAWGRTLQRVARHDEHPWNESLMADALVAEGRGCWHIGTTSSAGAHTRLATLGR